MSVFTRLLASSGDNALAVLFPALCLLCDQPRGPGERWFCPECLEKLHTNNRDRRACPRCGLNQARRTCTCQLVWDHPFECIHALFDFDDTVKQVVHQVKYGGKSRLMVDMGRVFGAALPAAFTDGVDAMIPIPLHPLRRLRRGYNQADCFARGVVAGLSTGLAYLPCAVRRRRRTATQTMLDRDERRQNLAGAFVVPPSHVDVVRGKRLILVDDVVTTGATTGECTRALLDAGAAGVRVLSLARD
jgi:ComF family protein